MFTNYYTVTKLDHIPSSCIILMEYMEQGRQYSLQATLMLAPQSPRWSKLAEMTDAEMIQFSAACA